MQNIIKIINENKRRHPGKIAIHTDNRSISYQQLVQKSTRLVNGINKYNKNTDGHPTILLYTPKCVAAITTIIASLATGAVFIPISYKTPCKRVARIISNSNVDWVITSSKKITKLSSCAMTGSAQYINISDNNAGNKQFSTVLGDKNKELPVKSIDIKSTAVRLYTSGSTGSPKGVNIPHESITDLINWGVETFSFSRDYRVLNVSSLAFDITLFDFLTAFCAGGSVYLPKTAAITYPARIAKIINRYQVNSMFATPSVYIHLMQCSSIIEESLPNLKNIFFAGELFPLPQLKKLNNNTPENAKLVNLYGAVEANIVTYQRITNKHLEQGVIPIGGSRKRHRCWAVDNSGQTVSIGETGEMVVAGPAVANGYHNKDDSRFGVTDDGMRMFYTHDIVKRIGNNNWAFVQRRDRMVKVRGFRVELGEIEHCIEQAKNVKRCVTVTAKKNNDRIIVSYVQPEKSKVRKEALYKRCNQYLEPYMVPNSIYIREKLPHTKNNKIDRTELKKQARQCI